MPTAEFRFEKKVLPQQHVTSRHRRNIASEETGIKTDSEIRLRAHPARVHNAGWLTVVKTGGGVQDEIACSV